MTDTTENTKPTPPPTDREVVAAFIEEAEAYDRKAVATGNEEDEVLYRAAAEARRTLAKRLEDNKAARAAYVKETTDRLVKAATDAGKAVADFLNKAYASAEERADQDRK